MSESTIHFCMNLAKICILLAIWSELTFLGQHRNLRNKFTKNMKVTIVLLIIKIYFKLTTRINIINDCKIYSHSLKRSTFTMTTSYKRKEIVFHKKWFCFRLIKWKRIVMNLLESFSTCGNVRNCNSRRIWTASQTLQ